MSRLEESEINPINYTQLLKLKDIKKNNGFKRRIVNFLILN